MDLVLFLDSFRNIDVFLQGLYYLQITVSGNTYPYYSDFNENLKKFHNLSPPQILDSIYTTKIFLLKYAEEIVKFGEIVIFRVEIDPKESEFPELDLQVDLMFTDIGGNLSPNSVHHFLNNPGEESMFKKVSEVNYKVKTALCGVNQMVFVTFYDSFSSSLLATVHVFAANYKVQGDYAEKIFPELAQNVSEDGLNTAYDTYLLPLGLGYNKLATLIYENKAQLLFLPVLKNTEEESDYILKTINRTLYSKVEKSRNRYEVAEGIFQEIQEVAARVVKIKHEFLNCLKENPEIIVQKLMKDYITLMDDRWGENIIREIRYEKIPIFSNFKAYNEDLETARRLKSSSNFAQMHYFHVSDDKVFSTPENNTIIFESIFAKEQHCVRSIQTLVNNSGYSRSRHLIVLVHGYLGSYIDVKMLQDTISNVYPKGIFLLSRANEGHTDGSILEMGIRLSKEIKEFIRTYSSILIDKVSFVGHSLGGLIIRASLPHLPELRDKAYSYISLACPHLGCTNNESLLIDAGMWVLCKIKQSQLLNQLVLKDTKNVRQSALFELSKTEGLGWFRRVYFFSSCQDSYVPFHSARVEVGNSIVEGDTLEYEMANNILSQITGSFHRVNTVFFINPMEVGNLIGRSAHVMFLDNMQFLNILVFKYIV